MGKWEADWRTGCNEMFSGFANIGHNDPFTLIFMWILPKYVPTPASSNISS